MKEKKEERRSEEIAQDICGEYERLSGNRANWESHWDEIAARLWPSHKDAFTSRGFRTPGEKRNQEVVDSTASLALNRFGAILDSLLTPRNQTWHRLTSSNRDLNKDRTVRLWFEAVNRILFEYRYSPEANFASQNQQNYKSLGAFGTGCMFVDELAGSRGLRYRAIHLGEIYFSENHQGMINRALRYFPLTARQAMSFWGKEKLPEPILRALESNPEREFFFIHCVKEKENYDPDKKDFKGMPYGSYYVHADTKTLMSEGGFQTFPYAISRYEQSLGEVYGRGPAMDILPAVKTLNEQKRTLLKQGHRAVDPVLLTHDDGIIDTFSLKPGAINAGGVTADGRPLVQALPTGSIAIGKDLMDDERALINDAFLVTLFQILVDTPQMTATEVLERTREKGILLAPTIGRQQSEYLGPLIDRELDLLSRQRIIPPLPEALIEAQGEYKIEYDSPLSRAQRAEEAAGLMRTVETALNIAAQTQNPEPLDYFDWDKIVPEVGEIQGVPARWMRSFQEVQIMRQARAEQLQIQQAIQAGPAVAAVTKASAIAEKTRRKE